MVDIQIIVAGNADGGVLAVARKQHVSESFVLPS